MSLTERDLRDALAPLAGDPTRDAHAVLAGLPPGPPPPPPGLPPTTWWLTGASLLVGLGLGLGIGWATAGPGAEVPVAEKATDEPKQKPPEEKPPPEKKEQPEVMLMAFGNFWLTEPPEPPKEYAAGGWQFNTGATVRTLADSRAGLMVYSSDVQLRLDRDGELLLAAPTQLSLERGRLFVNSGSAGAEVEVETPLGKVMVGRGQAMVTATPERLEVLAVMGDTVIRPVSGPPRQIGSRQRLRIDVDRGAEPVEDVAFLGTATSWMTEMIVLQQDLSEMWERVGEMVRVYEHEEQFREAAAREIRMLDYRCVTSLVVSIQGRNPSDETYRRNAAELVGQISNFFTAEYLFPLLDDPDPVVRTTIFLALVEATGTDGDTGTTFWREASPAERQAAIAEWKQKLR